MKQKLKPIGEFKVGDRVKFHADAGIGTVLSNRADKIESIGTPKYNSCCVEWDDATTNNDNPGHDGGMVPGKNISISLSSTIYKELNGNHTITSVEKYVDPKFSKEYMEYEIRKFSEKYGEKVSQK